MSIVADVHTYLLISLIAAIAIVVKVAWHSTTSSIDQSINTIAAEIHSCENERIELESKNIELNNRLVRIGQYTDDVLQGAKATVESIRIATDNEMALISQDIENQYNEKTYKIYMIMQEDMYNTIVDDVISKTIDSMKIDADEHKRINDCVIGRMV